MLQGTDFGELLRGKQNNYDEFKAFMWEKFKIDEIISSYKNYTSPFLDKHLSFYKSHMPLRTAFFLFWIWDKELDISEEKLGKFIESFYIGTFGYKMIDVLSDSQNANAEMIFIGFYAIKVAENLLSQALGNENTTDTILKNFKVYTDIEYFEKK